MARLLGGSAARQIDEILDLVGLAEWRDERIGHFSQGMRQRLSIGRALLHDPTVLLLDEPFSGLDETGSAVVRELLQRFRSEGRGVILVTHQLDRLSGVATHVGFLIRRALVGPEPVPEDPDGTLIRYTQLLRDD